MITRHLIRCFSLVFLLVTLIACTESGNVDNPVDEKTNDSIGQVEKNTVEFKAFIGGPAALSETVFVPLLQGLSDIQIRFTGEAVSSVTKTDSKDGINLEITPRNINILGVGVFVSTIEVYACVNDDCEAGHLAGSPQFIDVIYTITPDEQLQISSNIVNTLAYEGQAADYLLTLTSVGDTDVRWNADVEYISGSIGWLSLSKTQGEVIASDNLLLIFGEMSQGDYTAKVNFSYNNDAYNKTIIVNYSVNPVFSGNSTATITINESSSRSVLSRDIGLFNNLYNSLVSEPYTANCKEGWLSVVNNSGNLTDLNQLSVVVDEGQIKDMPNGLYTCDIIVATDNINIADHIIPVALHLDVNPEIVLSEGSLNYLLTESTGFTDLARTINISTNLGEIYNEQIDWAIVSTSPLYRVSPASGKTGVNNSFDVTLNLPNIRGMSNVTDNSGFLISITSSAFNNITVPVSITKNVNKQLVSSNNNADINADIGTIENELTATFTIMSNLGEVFYQNLSWDAMSDQSWLNVQSETGDTDSSNTLTVNVPVSELAQLENGVYNATIALSSADENVSGANVGISLYVRYPRISYVSPYAISTNIQQNIILRGSDFSTISDQALLFDDVVVDNYTIISDTEIHVDHPVYTSETEVQLNIENALNIDLTSAHIDVVNHPVMAQTTFSIPGRMSSVYYHHKRKALIMGHPTGSIVIYDYQPDGSWLRTTKAVSGLRDIAISTDGNEILAIDDNYVKHYDAYTLDFIKESDIRTNLKSGRFTDGFYLMNTIEMSNEGSMVIGSSLYGSGYTPIYLYDTETGDFNSIGSIYGARMNGSDDGSFVIIGGNGTSPPQRIYYYRASDKQVYSSGIGQSAFSVITNRIGNRAAVEGSTVYDDLLTVVGTTPYYGYLGFSPDGNEAYGYSTSDDTLYVYDTSVYLGSSGVFPVLTSFYLGDSTTRFVTKIISRDDGEVIFLISNNDVVVLPR